MRFHILILIASFFLSLASSANAQFLNLPQYDNGVNLGIFTKADLNNDGKTDIVGTQINNGDYVFTDITVLLGTGTGGFGAPIVTTISGVDSPGFPILGDFNDDGKLDVAVFGKDHVTGQNAIAVMLGNGDGTFQAGKETIIASGGNSGFDATNTADFNGDGKLDIAYVNGYTVNILPGKGDGTFSALVTTSTGIYGFSSITSGDFNNDKKLDIAGSTGGGSIVMMLGNGNGSFASPFVVGKGGGSTIIAAQLNADTDLDLVAVQRDDPPAITVLLGNGTGHFPTTHTYSGPQASGISSPPVVRDLNGDGHADIAWLGSSDHAEYITILLNNGDGSFTSKMYNGDGLSSSRGFLAADLNGDGKIDLAFGNNVGGFSVLEGNGNGTFKGNFIVPAEGQGLREGLFTGDTKPDLLSWGSAPLILVGNGDGTFTVKTINSACSSSASPALGDFNLAGTLDFAGAGEFNGVSAIGVCLNNGNTTFTAGGHFDQGIQHALTLAGDFNNDGKLDLVTSDEHGFSVLLNSGGANFESGIPTAVSATFPDFVVSDFNNDGKADVAALTSSGVEVFLGKGDGSFEAPKLTALPTAGSNMLVADFNLDGNHDLILATGNSLTGLTVLLGKGDGTFQPPVSYSLHGGALTQPVIADFNHDGHLDIAIGVTTSVNHVDSIDVFFGDGTGKLTGPTTFRVGGPISALVTADFNGDKKPDLAYILDGLSVVTMLNQ
jgi:hypothetical protein